MATWIKLSNGHEACQTSPFDKTFADWKELGLPTSTYGQTEYPSIYATTETSAKWHELEAKHLEAELQDYINEKFPGEAVTLESRKRLPYGASPSFGSGDHGGHFCYTPRECAGRSSCPKRYACSE